MVKQKGTKRIESVLLILKNENEKVMYGTVLLATFCFGKTLDRNNLEKTDFALLRNLAKIK